METDTDSWCGFRDIHSFSSRTRGIHPHSVVSDASKVEHDSVLLHRIEQINWMESMLDWDSKRKRIMTLPWDAELPPLGYSWMVHSNFNISKGLLSNIVPFEAVRMSWMRE
eukprot:204946_1